MYEDRSKQQSTSHQQESTGEQKQSTGEQQQSTGRMQATTHSSGRRPLHLKNTQDQRFQVEFCQKSGRILCRNGTDTSSPLN